MDIEYAVLGIVIIFLVGLAGYALLTNNSPASTTTQKTTTTTQSTQTKFTSSPYYNYAYLISGTSLSSAAQTALTGFKLSTTTLSNGDIEYNLTATEAGYTDLSATISSGQKLYFIEMGLGDDSGTQDLTHGDDALIKVDSNGYIIQ